ncbi:YhgE/Pip domain-containing protein [Clostridium perfringens]
MKFKKIISFFLIVISVFIISFLGLNFSKKIENNIVKSNTTKVSSNIAIVNQDTGVEKGDKYINYSEKIIENLDSKYIVTSREIAKKGLKNGEFSALIVFPGKFSDNVTSINNENPEKAQFYFELSPKLSNVEKAETEESITKLEREINDKISYIYVANILNEFHDSQDKVIDVLENDNEQVKKILSINDNDLVKSINIRDFEKLKIDINTLNLDDDFNKNQKVMEDMDANYKKFLAEGNDDLNKIKSTANDLIIKEGGLLSFLGNIANINVLPGYFNGIQFKDVIENFQDKFEKLFTTTSNDIKEYQDNQMEDLSKNNIENLNNNNKALTKQVTEISKNINDIGEASNKMLEEIYKPLEDYIKDIKPNIKETKIVPPQLSITAYKSMYQNISTNIEDIFDNKIPDNLNLNNNNLNNELNALKTQNKINALISETAITLLLNGEPTTQESLINLSKSKIEQTLKIEDIKSLISYLENNDIKDLDGYLNYIFNKNPNIQPRNEKADSIDFGLKQVELSKSFDKFKINYDSIKLADYKNLILRDIDEELKNFDKIENGKLKEANNFYNERYENIKKSYVGQVDSIKEDLIGKAPENNENKGKINEIKKLNQNLINDIINKLTNEDNENKGFMAKIKDSLANSFSTLVNSSDKSISETSDLLDKNIETKEEILKNENITYMSGIREFIKGTEADTKEELKKSFMEKQEPLAKLDVEIEKYNPIDYITKNQSVFNNLIGDYNQNNSDISKKISEQDQKNIKFTEETYEKADEHVEQLKEDVLKTKEESEKLITDGLKDTKEVSINNTKENKKLMESFSNKLPYTRIGSLSNLKMYDFIATPLEAINTTNNNTEIKSSNSVVATSSKSNSDSYKKYILVGSLILVIFLIIGTKMVITYLKRKDKVENE